MLINHKALVENITDFEKTLLASKSAINSFLKEMEHAIRAHGDNPLLFSSLKRAILVIPNFDLSKKASLITLVISNCLSENDATLEFCISLLRQTYRVTSSVSSLQGTFIFSHDYTEAVRPFLTELASKFPSNTLVQLVEALLLYYQENPTKHQASTCLFTYFSVIKEPSTFIKAKFIPKLSAACDKMTRNTDYAAMLYMFRVLDALNAADHTLFFNEFIRTPENEFIALYTERYARHSESLGALLIPRIIELKNIDEKWKDFMIFDRIIKLFGGFIKSYVRDTTAPDRITGIIFALLIQISTANMLRKRGIKIDSYLYIFEISLSELRSSTGIDLISGSRLVLQNDNDFYELMNAFSHSFQYLQHEVTDLLLTSLNSLVPTKHCDTSLICTSSFLANVSHAHSEQCKKMKARAVDLFTTIMKKCQFETSLIGFIIAKSPSAFSANTLRQLNAEALTQFLSLSIESVNKSHDAVPPLELLLGIIRSSSGPFIGVHVQEIIDTLRNAVSANKVKIDSILVLNIIGELGRRKQVPTSLLKDSSVSFRSLAPLLLSNDQEINTRVTAIFSLMIFGSTDDNPDFELIFSSLMSLYVGYEKDSGHYVAIANDMLKYVTQVNKRVLDLLSHIFSPILSVGDSACNVAINEFLKFLRKQATSQDEELSTFAIHLMTVFAKPKRNIPVSSK
ncbi:hypothetical protein TRFO_13876 [Tritrichomonas foetus]|uniref:Uncharacterized protein n=1 Tax=Tritrichomonas foetus TaxID=1144522 RepID=A0A1J4KXU4_9EUKA|nr:hypothetical protein TRFO_13876 [Tritrichomonas foetus]|eukprot:OHT15712.1 hypothetical protein TRFO_13876 [Tritrichomonas foetus]